jgi:hypothetical protein
LKELGNFGREKVLALDVVHLSEVVGLERLHPRIPLVVRDLDLVGRDDIRGSLLRRDGPSVAEISIMDPV